MSEKNSFDNPGYEPDNKIKPNNQFDININLNKSINSDKNSSKIITPTSGASASTDYEKSLNYENYHPYDNRVVEHPTTNAETLIHLLKGSLGTGILAMPVAFKNSGYVTGIICTLLIGILCTYCIHMLLRASYEHCKRKQVPSMTYPQVAEAALLNGPVFFKKLANIMPHITNVFLMIFQLGTCCVYVVFVSSNIEAIGTYYMEQAGYQGLDVRIYMVMILLPLIFINWVRNLKYLAPLTTLANVITAISFGLITYYIFREPVTVEGKHAFGTIEDFPLYFGTVLFALEAIGVIFPLENEMKTPRKFGTRFGVLNIAMCVIVTLYIGMGLFGYLKFGSLVAGSLTLNLEKSEILSQCVKGMLAFSIYITHSLQCYVAIDIMWNDYIQKRLSEKRNKLFWEYVLRTSCVTVTFLLAVAIPNLELFISLVGALCLAVLGMALPAAIDLCTWWEKTNGRQRQILIISNLFIFIIGVIGFIVGTTVSLTEIIKSFINE